MITYSHLSHEELIRALDTNSWKLKKAIQQENNFWSKTLKVDSVIIPHCGGCEIITDFKFSNIPIKSTSFKDIFKYRVKACSFRLHNHYHRIESNYDSYEDFIKYVVFYGASHHSNQRFWEKLKRELY